ncbi:MAG: DUF3500 domain-containing protein [Planctomycetaceae bacterium]
MRNFSRRELLQSAGASLAVLAISPLPKFSGTAIAEETVSDSLPMQLYKSMTDEQRAKVCLPIDHPRRKYVSNWWYIHPDHRIPATFDADQQALIGRIFDSLHSANHQDAVREQVRLDQYGELKNAPAVGFFGTPDHDDFEFIYTGHHVTRRCNAHTDKGLGFGGNPIFYGHFRDEFNETADHPGNPYWYQGKVFNEFVQSLDESQRKQALLSTSPRSENPDVVVKKKTSEWSGLSCSQLSADQKTLFKETMKKMLAMFREDDVNATMASIGERGMVDRLYVSWYDGKYDIGSDQVWDTWQIEGPEMVWYFRGQPHIHSYFHLKT